MSRSRKFAANHPPHSTPIILIVHDHEPVPRPLPTSRSACRRRATSDPKISLSLSVRNFSIFLNPFESLAYAPSARPFISLLVSTWHSATRVTFAGERSNPPPALERAVLHRRVSSTLSGTTHTAARFYTPGYPQLNTPAAGVVPNHPQPCRPPEYPPPTQPPSLIRAAVAAERHSRARGRNNSTGEPVYRKVAVVENFFDIIYNVHVELEGRPGKHAGQKRTYRTITETYAFLPREAVTRFLLGCTECQKHPRSPSPASVLPTPSPSPTLPLVQTPAPPLPTPPPAPPADVAPFLPNSSAETLDLSSKSNGDVHSTPEGPLRTSTPTPELKRSTNPLDVCNLTAKDPPKSPPKKRPLHGAEKTPKLWSPVESIEREQETRKKRILMGGDIDYSLPITTTYLKYMRSLGCTDEDALKFENKHVSLVIEHFLHEAIGHYFY
ncbi:hypothetical protein Zmor_019919 [Zophobas morio]|uniref:Nucleolar protein 4 n=1 Tax=Zophobas morio TaxID=2755281 RepID=A0AA38M9A9_9CUCU|nr:hypothetical protein Zmor_019919 [Zophobas morio]